MSNLSPSDLKEILFEDELTPKQLSELLFEKERISPDELKAILTDDVKPIKVTIPPVVKEIPKAPVVEVKKEPILGKFVEPPVKTLTLDDVSALVDEKIKKIPVVETPALPFEVEEKPKFNPNYPYSVKPDFDPSKPFTLSLLKELKKEIPKPASKEEILQDFRNEMAQAFKSIKVPAKVIEKTIVEKIAPRIEKETTVVKEIDEETKKTIVDLADEVKRIKQYLMAIGGSGVIGIPNPEGNNGKTLQVEKNQAKWVTASSSGGSGFSLPDYTLSNITTDRAFDADNTSLDELADVLGTLINDLSTGGGGGSSDSFLELENP